MTTATILMQTVAAAAWTVEAARAWRFDREAARARTVRRRGQATAPVAEPVPAPVPVSSGAY
ncbi:hypothetical protein [Streptomyces eurythermus]|uniref:hypothetical protein n=1 Tax=Streptomyces eurythermus TaxID=42237 RepID=UPI0036D2DBC4